jgi:tRNA A-37 threonylcarbamoyl transferase component Bud32
VLVEQIGSGGMADVYRAIAPGAAGVSKSVCIKRIRDARLQNPRLVSLFIDEARISMQLSHPNIVHTYDFGRVGDEYFLALELIEGVDLATLIDSCADRGESLSPEEIAAVGESVCRALAHVHTRRRGDGKPLGLVHRDVTPPNVLLTREGDVKLTDFGVARLRENVNEGLRGTLAYMAPEQANRGAVDPRTDVFGLALVLFECVRARPAYAGTRDEVLALAQRGVLDLARTDGEAPLEAALLDVIARATAREPADRTGTAAVMAEELGRIVAQARAAGVPDPRASLARRVAAYTSTAATGGTTEVPAAVDARAAVSYTLDGDAPDFAERLGATELSQAATHADPPPRPGPVAAPRGRWIGLAAVAGVLLGLAMAVAWPAGSSDRGDRATTRESPPRTAVATPRSAPAKAATEVGPRAAEPARAAPRVAAEAVEAVPAPRTPPPRAPATLDLNAIPWADVWVDGVARGTTPVRGISLAGGRHRVRLVNGPLGVERTIAITLRAGETRAVVVNLRDDGTNVAPPPAGPP